MIKTIAKNRTKLIADLFARAKDCRCYSLEGGFCPQPCGSDHVRRNLERYKFAKLTQGEGGTYTVYVHSNLWYEFTVAPGPETGGAP